jgi:ankyrin repeat protein
MVTTSQEYCRELRQKCTVCDLDCIVWKEGISLLREEEIDSIAVAHKTSDSGWRFDHLFHFKCILNSLNHNRYCPKCDMKIFDKFDLCIVTSSENSQFSASRFSMTVDYRMCQLWRTYKNDKPQLKFRPISDLFAAVTQKDSVLVLKLLEGLSLETKDNKEEIDADLQACCTYAIEARALPILEFLIKWCVWPEKRLSESQITSLLLLMIEEDNLPLFKLIVERETFFGEEVEQILMAIIEKNRREMLEIICSQIGFAAEEPQLKSLLSEVIRKKQAWALKPFIAGYYCDDKWRRNLIRQALFAEDMLALEILCKDINRLEPDFLLFATESGSMEMVEYVYSKSPSITPKNRGKAIISAIASKWSEEKAYVEIARFLLKNIEGGEFSAPQLSKAVELAAHKGAFHLLEELIRPEIVASLFEDPRLSFSHSAVEKYEGGSRTCEDFWNIALYTGVEKGQMDLVKGLCSKRKFKDEALDRAILKGCLGGRLSIIHYLQATLLERGSKCLENITTAEIENALRISCAAGYHEVVDFLLEERTLTDESMRTSLRVAVTKGFTDIVQLLLKKVSLSSSDTEELLPLVIDARSPPIFKILLTNQIDLSSLARKPLFELIRLSDEMLEIFLSVAGSMISADERAYAMGIAIRDYVHPDRSIELLLQNARSNGEQIDPAEIARFVTQTVQSNHEAKVKLSLLRSFLVTTNCDQELNLASEIVQNALSMIIEMNDGEDVRTMIAKLLKANANKRTIPDWDALMEPLLTKAIANRAPNMVGHLLEFGEISVQLQKKCIEQPGASESLIENYFKNKLPPAEKRRLLWRCWERVAKVMGNILFRIQKPARWAWRTCCTLFRRSESTALPQ